MWPNPQCPADLLIFTEEILNGKFHILCSDKSFCQKDLWWKDLAFRLITFTRFFCQSFTKLLLDNQISACLKYSHLPPISLYSWHSIAYVKAPKLLMVISVCIWIMFQTLHDVSLQNLYLITFLWPTKNYKEYLYSILSCLLHNKQKAEGIRALLGLLMFFIALSLHIYDDWRNLILLWFHIKQQATMREKCPYSELFLSECGKISTRITPNKDTLYAVQV